jgi:hypothetical protein
VRTCETRCKGGLVFSAFGTCSNSARAGSIATKEGGPEAKYLETLRKARPDLVDKVHHVQKRESRSPRKEWWPKSTRVDVRRSANTHMVFVLLAEFHA